MKLTTKNGFINYVTYFETKWSGQERLDEHIQYFRANFLWRLTLHVHENLGEFDTNHPLCFIYLLKTNLAHKAHFLCTFNKIKYVINFTEVKQFFFLQNSFWPIILSCNLVRFCKVVFVWIYDEIKTILPTYMYTVTPDCHLQLVMSSISNHIFVKMHIKL